MPISKKKYFTTREVADQLEISVPGVNRLIQRGRLEAEKFGQIWVISKENLDAYLGERRQPGNPNFGKAAG